jgi:O-antigen/teichoic acid export membrane protein
MSLKNNLLASYASQIYVTLIGIVMVPLYLHYLGDEAYGMVGFFAMLQAWFQLLDMGLTPTLARESARYVGGATSAGMLRSLLRSLECIFAAVAVVGAGIVIVAAPLIASRWLKVEQLDVAEVERAVVLMSLIIALRWMSGLSRGIVTGFEQLVWLSGFNTAAATARFVLVIPFFAFVSTGLTEFFTYQLVVALAEFLVLLLKAYRLLPAAQAGAEAGRWEALRGVLAFSMSVAFTSSIWVVVTQTDKLMLSKLLPLSDYAYFTLAVLIASGVSVVSGPIAGVLMPRLAKLAAEANDDGLTQLYRKASQLVAVVALPAAMVLFFFAEEVLWAWTGKAALAATTGPILALYALGNGILTLGAFPYYLQFAKGDLKLHLWGNLMFVVFLVPALLWATTTFGMVGAGYTWLALNVLYFVFWVPLVHRRFVPGLHMAWLGRDLLPIALATVLPALLANSVLTLPAGRVQAGLAIGVLSVVLLACAALGASAVRAVLLRRMGTFWNAQCPLR